MSAPSIARFRVVLLAVLAGAVAFLFYARSAGSEFVYDARPQVLFGDYIHDPSHWGEVLTFRVLGQDVLDANRPVQLASLMFDSALWGRNPVGYHLTSAALHAANVALLFLLLMELGGGRTGPALIATLAFAVHPMLVEPVAEVSSREDVLALFFLLLAMLLALRCGRSAGRAMWWTGAGCVVASLLAVGAKETGVIAPVLVGACGLLFRERGTGRRWVVMTALVAAVVGGFVAARFALEPRESVIFLSKPGRLGGSLVETLKIQPRIWGFYVRQIFWPAELSAIYTPQNVGRIAAVWLYLMLAALVLVQGVAVWRSRVGLLGMLMYWAALGPVSNLLPMYCPAADRYLYVPLAGLALTIFALLAWVRSGARAWPFLAAGCAVVLTALAWLGWQRQEVFADSFNLWTDTVAKSPISDNAANNLGYAWLRKGDNARALAAFERALQLTNGKKADAWAGAAIALDRMGRPSDAVRALRSAVEIMPIYGNPDQLVKSLVAEPADAEAWREIRSHAVIDP